MTAVPQALRHSSLTPLVTLLAGLLMLMGVSTPASALGSSVSSLFGSDDTGFLPVDEALPFSFRTEEQAVVLFWDVTPGHYLYRGRISIDSTDDSVKMGTPSFSQDGERIEDEFFGEVEVFYDPVEARIPVTLPAGVREAQLQVTYQGCASAGLCYPPQTREVFFYPGKGVTTATSQAPDTQLGNSGGDGTVRDAATLPDTESATGLAGFLESQSIAVIAALFFLLGLGLTFTPCVLPMVPIISSLVSHRNTQTTGHALVLSCSYVLGMALTYAAAGVLTGLAGASFNLQAQLQSPWVLSIFASLFVLFALSMFDVFELQLPRFIREPLNQASHRITGTRVFSLFGIGAISALIVSPCVSAPLAGSLLYISTTQDAVIGGVALLSLGLGMGVPLILVAVGGRKFLPSTGQWMTAVKHLYGVMLMAVAIWLIERLVPAWLALTLWALLVAITGVQLGAFDAAKAGWERTRKGLGLLLFAYGLALLAGAMGGASDPLKPLTPFTAATQAAIGSKVAEHAGFNRVESPAEMQAILNQARNQNRPVILDFYADWCISCKVMERNVFSDPQVARAMSDFTLLQIDMTDNTTAQQALLDELGLFGPPAILFFNPDGQEMTDRRVLGEMDRDQFLRHLQQLGS
ncbi:protein-disulfide reductase DsbD [Marinobacter salinisoli]|uniref:Thiol:disulfide interchange protein DsbD n=1 Tax=Marinobacter salinisoli TaxID=2769486 RepID=A0ABX7MMX7_9GAMM|nr:protein-disulfide reductase DsbD [Marinobacter salinisoli]QSP93585.1 protein-disulfide reductase DsbD [Marinobacter salinisoli]